MNFKEYQERHDKMTAEFYKSKHCDKGEFYKIHTENYLLYLKDNPDTWDDYLDGEELALWDDSKKAIRLQEINDKLASIGDTTDILTKVGLTEKAGG